MTDKRVLIAYHADCIDGFTSAWVMAVAVEAKGFTYDLLPMNYHTESYDKLLKRVLSYGKYKKVYIVDFSVPKYVLRSLELCQPSPQVYVYDHHKTAFENYSPETMAAVQGDAGLYTTIHGADIYLKNDLSGAGICWEDYGAWHKPGYGIPKLPSLIRYVQDYDLWKFFYGADTKYINNYLSSLEKTIDVWSSTANLLQTVEGLKEALEKGKELQEDHDLRVVQIASGSEPMKLRAAAKAGLAVECPPAFTNDVGHALARECGTYAVMTCPTHITGEYKHSLRSEGDFDVSAIAKKYGGGGHKNAAGFTSTCRYPDFAEPLDGVRDLAF